ncbi:hypothetical protein ENBRE01_0378 [Enteropsectra breve]|nr:hypothetical protein ENBRE01_0378 [Enteropsectra breve]
MDEETRRARLAELIKQREEMDLAIKEIELALKAAEKPEEISTNIPYTKEFLEKQTDEKINLKEYSTQQLIEIKTLVNKKFNQLSSDFSHTSYLIDELLPHVNNPLFREFCAQKLIEQGRIQVSAQLEFYKPLSYLISKCCSKELLDLYIKYLINRKGNANEVKGMYAIYFGYLNLAEDVPGCWFWLASVLNSPVNEMSGYVLEVFLKICGEMMKEKCTRFKKILKYLKDYYVKEIKNSPVEIRIGEIIEKLK